MFCSHASPARRTDTVLDDSELRTAKIEASFRSASKSSGSMTGVCLGGGGRGRGSDTLFPRRAASVHDVPERRHSVPRARSAWSLSCTLGDRRSITSVSRSPAPPSRRSRSQTMRTAPEWLTVSAAARTVRDLGEFSRGQSTRRTQYIVQRSRPTALSRIVNWGLPFASGGG